MNKEEALRKMFEELGEMKKACDKLAHQRHCYVMGLDCENVLDVAGMLNEHCTVRCDVTIRDAYPCDVLDGVLDTALITAHCEYETVDDHMEYRIVADIAPDPDASDTWLTTDKHCKVERLCMDDHWEPVEISDEQERLAHWAINLLCRENQI